MKKFEDLLEENRRNFAEIVKECKEQTGKDCYLKLYKFVEIIAVFLWENLDELSKKEPPTNELQKKEICWDSVYQHLKEGKILTLSIKNETKFLVMHNALDASQVYSVFCVDTDHGFDGVFVDLTPLPVDDYNLISTMDLIDILGDRRMRIARTINTEYLKKIMRCKNEND